MKSEIKLIYFLQLFAIAGIAIFCFWLIADTVHIAHAFPEYAQDTGESCATCHVNPGGGGPRTLRGALWAAKGRPDAVPSMPGVLLAPGVNDGAELYEISCATCHGLGGEGLFGREIANTGLTAGKVRSNILNGRLNSGMPAFKGMYTDEQLQSLIDYTVALSIGKVKAPPAEYPLPEPSFNCKAQLSTGSCGGN
jgi:mono/diheme cytochrome c family protein